MSECICSSCKNLRSVLDDEDGAGVFDCSFGFPSDKCDDCEGGDCDITCCHYESDEEADLPVTVKCSKCGKELKKTFRDDDEGDVMCVDCYLG